METISARVSNYGWDASGAKLALIEYDEEEVPYETKFKN